MTIEGVWRSRGYGWIFEVSADEYAVHDVTRVSSTKVVSGSRADFAKSYMPLREEGGSVISLHHAEDITRYTFDRIAQFPKHSRPVELGTQDANVNFNVLWHLFDENYAFFDLRGVDWASVYDSWANRLTAATSDDELMDVLNKVLGPLQDNHVHVSSPTRSTEATDRIGERKEIMAQAFGVRPWIHDRRTYTDTIQQRLGQLLLDGRFQLTNNSMMLYGEIVPGIGYFNVMGEYGYGTSDRALHGSGLPVDKIEGARFIRDEMKCFESALDEVMTALADKSAIVIDVRMNYGGYDRLALAVASRFTDKRALAYRKKAFTPNGFAGHQDIFVEPSATPYLKPVYLLTGRQTASAGEVLVLGMMACPNVTRIGEATLGILSDNLMKTLPNSWEVSLSNEIYELDDGTCYEQLGIPPDIEIPVFDPSNVIQGFKHTVDRTVSIAQAKR